jgi:hypothetical protein
VNSKSFILFFTIRYSHLSVCRLYHLLSLLPSDPVVTPWAFWTVENDAILKGMEECMLLEGSQKSDTVEWSLEGVDVKEDVESIHCERKWGM